MIICQEGNNPYLKNPHASLKRPQSQITHEGKLYTKLSYELKINTAARLIKIIQVIALVIFSCFLALAFQSMRKLWFEAIKGARSVDVLIPQVFSECTDIWMLIASKLSIRDLLALRTTSTQKRCIAEMTLINHLNEGKITPEPIGISTFTGLIDFFGENCSQITKLNLQEIPQINDSDIENLSKQFEKLNHLLLKNSVITNASGIHLEKMVLLTTFDLSDCREINDFSSLQHCKELSSLNLYGCNQINDISFLQDYKELTSLNLVGCRQINESSVKFLRNKGVIVSQR